MGEVVVFPWSHRIVPPATLEEIHERAESVSTVHVSEATSTIIEMVFDELQVLGFDFVSADDGKYAKDGILLSEALRSMLLRFYGKPHELQKTAEQYFDHAAESMTESEPEQTVDVPDDGNKMHE